MLVVCSNMAACTSVFRVMGEWQEIQSLVGPRSEFWPLGYTCPKCSGPAQGVMESEIDLRLLAGVPVRDIEAQEMYRAQYGMGLPEEMDCRREIIEQTLRENPIKKIAGHEVPGANRFVLEHLELWDGTKVYFGGSSHGAIITRIVPLQSHVTRVLKEHEHG